MKNEKTQILQQLTTEEKLRLTTGDGFWQTAAVERLNVLPVTMSDGPVGLRKEQDGKTISAVCFPSVSKLACSFDPRIVQSAASAIGEQCRAENVRVLLAPALNIKRNPLCGRNFEYFSEDPFLTAELATAYINGVNSQEVGVCVKHFAANNQEYGRRVCDSVIDSRALYEIYLSAFEKVIKNTSPCAVMCAYNKLNGEYCSQNKTLLTDILRNKFGFDGLVMSDWGATDDRAKGIRAGLNLQMPQGDLRDVKKALSKGELSQDQLDDAVLRVLEFDNTEAEITSRTVDLERQHKLVGKINADCTVLAKNQCNLLPFAKTDKVALIGALAETPYFQGGGSSKVNAYKVESLKQAMEQKGVNFRYAKGYVTDGVDESLIDEAQKIAAECQKVLLVVGDYASESEGYDRASWCLPECQLKLIDAVTSANGNVAIVVQSGAPIDVSWHHCCRALILDYLSGENSGALADVVYGDACPTGRLAETWPLSLPSCARTENYKRTLYKESIYVGYRFYTTANVDVAFPFGYGLNYSHFKWSDVTVAKTNAPTDGKFTVSLEVENVGSYDDADTVQVYVTNADGRNFYAAKNLVAFKKVPLKVGAKKKVTLSVDVADFASYNDKTGNMEVNGGKYLLTVAKNCNDTGTVLEVFVDGENKTAYNQNADCYYNIDENFCPTDEQFEKLYGTFPQEKVLPFSVNSPLGDLAATWFGKRIVQSWTKNRDDKRTLLATPLIDFVYVRDISVEMIKTLTEMSNGKFFRKLPLYLWQKMMHNFKTKRAQKKSQGK